MRKFLIKILLFTVLIFSLFSILNHVKFSDDFIIYKVKNTSYHKLAWDLSILKNESNRIKNSTLIFGSSISQTGLCDSTLNLK